MHSIEMVVTESDGKKTGVLGELVVTALSPILILMIVSLARDNLLPGSDTVNELISWLTKLAPEITVVGSDSEHVVEIATKPAAVAEKIPVLPPEPVPKPEIQATTVPEPEPKVTSEHKTPESRAVVRDYDLARLNLSQIAHPSEMTSRLPTTEEVASLAYNIRNMYSVDLTDSQIETAFRDGYVEIRGERFQLWENNKTPEFYLTPTPSVR